MTWMRICLSLAAAAALMAGPAWAGQTARPDGSLIDWSLDRRAGGAKQGLLLLAQGSGCESVLDNANIERGKGLLPDFAVLTVEKYGVAPHSKPAATQDGCSPTFYAHHTISQRVEDYQRVLALVEREPWWNGQLVLFGGSEGGAAVTLLAPRVHPSATVIFSTGPGQTFRQTFKLAVPPPVWAEAEAVFARVEAAPESAEVWGGNSYRWWADILDHDLLADLLAVETPILIVHGENDRSAPVASARAARDGIRKADRCNLTYWEFPGYDHQMRDASGGGHIEEVLGRISGWLRRELAAPDGVQCGPGA
ncbi:MAG: hypothetical protein V4597_06820 [Pseudomonadota bacterium]